MTPGIFDDLMDILIQIVNGANETSEGRDYLRESIHDLRTRYEEANDDQS